MKTVSFVVALFFCLLAGCASHKPAEQSGPNQKFEASDDFKIEAAVYGYLLARNLGNSGGYTAIFLTGNDDRVAALIKKFPYHVPPLKPGDRAQLRPNQAPIDKDTGQLGLILSAKAVDPTNGVSEAVGTWYGGEEVSGLYAFVLVEMDGQWTIQSVK
jgi:hypothetical protein